MFDQPRTLQRTPLFPPRAGRSMTKSHDRKRAALLAAAGAVAVDADEGDEERKKGGDGAGPAEKKRGSKDR